MLWFVWGSLNHFMDLAAAAHPKACAEYECPCRRAFSYKNNHIDELCITSTIFFFGGGCVWGQQDRQNIINNKVLFGKRSWHKPKIICWKLGQYYISKFQSKEANWTFLNCFSNIIYYDINFETSADNLRC